MYFNKSVWNKKYWSRNNAENVDMDDIFVNYVD